MRREDANESIKKLWNFRHELYKIGGVPFLNGRMFLPQALRKDVIDTLHGAHQSSDTMWRAARQRFFWTGMDAVLVQKREPCRRCNEYAPSQEGEELVLTEPPTLPFEVVAMDFFKFRAMITWYKPTVTWAG